MTEKESAPKSLQALLDELSVARAELAVRLPDKAVRCLACGHRCYLPEGKVGICKVRRNRGGELYVPWGYVAGLQCDPVEKKPFFHAYPGSLALSFGMLGCDYHCSYCQNWITSQALRDPVAGVLPRKVTPEQIVRLAQDYGAKIVTSTYNEPLITSEWAVDIFRLAKAAGLVTSYVSNGNATPEVLEFLRPWVDLYKVDLKGFDDRHYRKLGGLLETVKRTIRDLVRLGFWVEVVTLLVPGFNDSENELRSLTEFLAGVSPDIPWHVTAFHPDYKMTDRDATTVDRLLFAARLGEEAGLRYVYVGNVPGAVGEYENTRCPQCRYTVVERRGYRVYRMELVEGRCPQCQTRIPGHWGDWTTARQQSSAWWPRPIAL
ncbi:MAG: AmmeMemoRadiSam system radical SAM enzyme [Candidatus Binatia bacterium]|nr:MAG: AmmeMemoRadiSam system radical SAM enzyme [Candidatus Binatia bacterium]